MPEVVTQFMYRCLYLLEKNKNKTKKLGSKYLTHTRQYTRTLEGCAKKKKKRKKKKKKEKCRLFISTETTPESKIRSLV